MKTSIMYGFRKLNFMHCPPLSSHPRAHTLTQMHSFSHSLSLSHYGEHIHFFRPHKCGSSLSLSKYRHTYNHGERKWNPIEPQFIMFYIYWPMLSFHRVKMSVHTFIFSFYRILLFIFPYIRPIFHCPHRYFPCEVKRVKSYLHACRHRIPSATF